MQGRFYDAFQELYRGVYRSPFAYWPGIASPEANTLREAIDDVSGEIHSAMGRQLRPDAKLLLLTLATSMAIAPAQVADYELAGRIVEDLRSDIEVVAREAARSGEGGEEISGHQIVDALSRTWRTLRASAWEIWD